MPESVANEMIVKINIEWLEKSGFQRRELIGDGEPGSDIFCLIAGCVAIWLEKLAKTGEWALFVSDCDTTGVSGSFVISFNPCIRDVENLIEMALRR